MNMFTAKISVNNRKAFEGLKNHLEYLCQLNGATIVYGEPSQEEKEKQIAILYKKFKRRLDKTKYSLTDDSDDYDFMYVTVLRNGFLHTGSCRKAEEDEYDYRIAEMLCYSRAFGWKDIEQELLDVLN